MTEELLVLARGQGTETDYRWPNKMGRMLLCALKDTIGRNGVNAVLYLAHLGHLADRDPPDNLDLEFRFCEISAIMYALEHMYGPHCGCSLARRVGRSGFKYGLKEFGSLLGLADLPFRLLPLDLKLQVGLSAIIGTLNNFTDQHITVQVQEERLLCHVERCPLCWGRHSDAPCCHAAVGLLQEMTTWVGNGTGFEIKETACVATGDAVCTFTIARRSSGFQSKGRLADGNIAYVETDNTVSGTRA